MNKCKNCDNDLKNIYCSVCGQKSGEFLTIKEIVKDFFDNILSLDSKAFITLKLLILKPGLLTLEYWNGKKAKYLEPFRLYLLLSVLYFLLTPMIKDGHYISSKEISMEEKSRALIRITENAEDRVDGIIWIDFTKEEIESSKLIKYFHTGILIAEKRDMTAEGILYASLPSSMFILMPFMAVIFLQLLYRKKNLFYSKHLITVIHLHSFAYLIFTLSNISIVFFQDIWSYIGLISNCAFLIYIFMMMKKIYKDSFVKTFLKFNMLLVVYSITLAITMAIVFSSKIFILGYFS